MQESRPLQLFLNCSLYEISLIAVQE